MNPSTNAKPGKPYDESARALESYLNGRWMLFTLLTAVPALSSGGVPSLILLILPCVTAFFGIRAMTRKGDINLMPLAVTTGSIIMSSLLAVIIAGISQGTAISLLSFSVFVGFTIFAIRLLELPARLNPVAVDKKTRIAATVASVLIGTLLISLIASLLIAIPFAMLFLFFLAGAKAAFVLTLMGISTILGGAVLWAGIRGRRNRARAREGNPALPHPVFHLGETVLFSIASSCLLADVILLYIALITH
jgi:hypothetical protein